MVELWLVESGCGQDESLATLLKLTQYRLQILPEWPHPGESDKSGIVILSWQGVGNSTIDSLISYRKAGGGFPVILVSEKQLTNIGRLRVYSAGADEYLTSPWDPQELLAILHSIARRPYLRKRNTIKLQGVVINLERQQAFKGGVRIQFTTAEYRIFEFLALHPRSTFSASTLLERLWSKPASVYEDTIRSHVRNIRRKIDSPGRQSLIRTVTGCGYMIEGDGIEVQPKASIVG